MAYVNMVGGQDELVFDGDSMIVDRGRRRCWPGRRSSPRSCWCSTSTCRPPPPTPPTGRRAAGRRHADRAGRAVAGGPGAADRPRRRRRRRRAARRRGRGLARRWCWACATTSRKNGFRSRSCSACPAASTRRWSPRSRSTRSAPTAVVGVSMPSEYSSEHSRDDAADLAKRTGLDYRVEPIQPMVDAFLANMSLSGLAVENLQARVRGVILMALSNQEGHLVLTTGNKSELAVGYSTLYGDSVGGFNPLKDVPKTLVWQLARWRNARRRRAAARRRRSRRTRSPSRRAPSCARASSTPTRCPTTSVLDAILAGYVDGDRGRDDLVAAGHDPALVDRVLRHGRPRRVQAPPVRARHEDLHQGVRPRPAPADHQPVPRRRAERQLHVTCRTGADRPAAGRGADHRLLDRPGDRAARPRGRRRTAMSEVPTLYGGPPNRRVRTRDLLAAKERGERWPMLTSLRPVHRRRSSTRPASRSCWSATRPPTTSSATRRPCRSPSTSCSRWSARSSGPPSARWSSATCRSARTRRARRRRCAPPCGS